MGSRFGRIAAAVAAGALASLAASASAKEACSFQTYAIPVRVVGTRIVVDVKFNGQPSTLTVDSGAAWSLLSDAAAAQFGLKLGVAPFGLFMTGVGGDFVPKLTVVDSFELGGLPYKRVDFLVGGSDASEGAGLLGQNFLHHYPGVEYDFAHGQIHLIIDKGCEGRDFAYWAPGQPHSVIALTPFDRQGRMTDAYALVNGQRIRVMFDTGAARSFLTFSAARRIGIDPDGPGVVRMGLGGGVGRRRVEERLAPVQSFKIGDEEVKTTRIPIGNTDLGEVDMLLGADFFLSHHVLVSNTSHKIFFTYNGGPIFDLRPRRDVPPGAPVAAASSSAAPESSPPKSANAPAAPTAAATAAGPDPTDAAGYASRGATALGQLRFGQAIADLSKAHELAPKDVRILVLRARAYEGDRQPALALGDLNAALDIDGKDVEARIGRAALSLTRRPRDGAQIRKDLDTASDLLPTQAKERLSLARLYQQLGAYDAARTNYEDWIKLHREDSNLPVALAGLCWSEAASPDAAQEAVSVCSRAMRASPKDPANVSRRGLAELRLGQDDRALADFDRSIGLSADGKAPWALFGKAVIEQRHGQGKQASRDLSAALKLAPKLLESAKDQGFPDLSSLAPSESPARSAPSATTEP